MPGNVANAVIPTVGGNPLVFPFALCRAFSETRAIAARINEYHDGTAQGQNLVATSRRSWKMTERLTPSQMSTLRTFMLAYPTAAFYFYDPKETAGGQLEGANYDATGASATGRYKVRIGNAELAKTIYIPRAEVAVELVETA